MHSFGPDVLRVTVYISSSALLSNKVAWVKSIIELPAGDEEALKHAVATIGPVSVGVHTSDDFMFYSHGNIIHSTSQTFHSASISMILQYCMHSYNYTLRNTDLIEISKYAADALTIFPLCGRKWEKSMNLKKMIRGVINAGTVPAANSFRLLLMHNSYIYCIKTLQFEMRRSLPVLALSTSNIENVSLFIPDHPIRDPQQDHRD